MKHKRIWLQVDEDEVSWCQDKIHDSDVEYVLAEDEGMQEALAEFLFNEIQAERYPETPGLTEWHEITENLREHYRGKIYAALASQEQEK